MSLPKELRLEIVTPERLLVRETVDEVVLPGELGEIGVLPGHTPLLTTLKVGPLLYRKGETRYFLAIALGFAEVLPDRVSVLAQIAEKAEEIDVARAESARQRAEQRLARPAPETNAQRAREAYIKASVRLQVANHARQPRS
jgi:F-type H+-transporting ATPase subunit epsilon